MLHFRMDMPLYLMALYGSIIILLVCILRRALSNRLPKFVFPLLWGLVLIRLLVPFSLSSPISAPVPDLPLPNTNNSSVYVTEGNSTTTTVIAGTDATYSISQYSSDSIVNWTLVLGTIYGLGAVATAGVLLSQKRSYTRKLKDSLLLEHNETINAILREMGMGHILVFSNDQIASPLVCGIWNPRIYLPTGMDFRQTQLLRHILAHETMHIKRKDNWLKAVMLLALCLHWYNPLVWLMSKYVSSDLEAACDAAVLRQTDEDQRQSYATSLLCMAITGNRPTLLYSAFSKTEVEHRIKNVLSYKKATSFLLAISMLFIVGSTIVFATAGQAPFSPYLSSYCSSTSSKWNIKAELTRDISLGKNAQQRANNIIFDALAADKTNDPDLLAEQVRIALAKEFHVEKNAFQLTVHLSLNEEDLAQEYAKQGITKGNDGFFLYQGTAVRTYSDEMLGSVQTRTSGAVDISVHRDRLGQITSVTALRKGDSEFDQRSKEIERTQNSRTEVYYGTAIAQNENPIVEQSTAVAVEKKSGFLHLY